MTLRTEKNAYRSTQFSYQPLIHSSRQEFEVLINIRGKDRRLALCTHEKDARVIAQAMAEYVERGGSWI